jgi:hypothetical protein
MSEVKSLQVVMSARPTGADSDDQPTSRVIRDTESKTTTSSNRSESSSSYEKLHALPPHYVHEPPSVEDDEKIQGIKEQMREFRKQDISSLEHVHSLLLQCHDISDNRISPALRGQGARLDNTVSRLTSVAHEAEQSDLLLNQLEDANKLIHVPTS